MLLGRIKSLSISNPRIFQIVPNKDVRRRVKDGEGLNAQEPLPNRPIKQRFCFGADLIIFMLQFNEVLLYLTEL